MQKGRINSKNIFWRATAVVLVLAFYFGFFYKSAPKQLPPRLIPVEIADVNTASIEETIDLTGFIKANSQVDIRSKVPGRIELLRAVAADGNEVAAEEGLSVKKGQRLAVIDHDVYTAELARAKAVLSASDASLSLAKVEISDAEREKKRMVALFEAGSATAQSKDKAVTTAEMADSKLKLAEAQLDQAKAALQLAEINLRESTIVSPIDGVITEKHTDEGNLIGVNDSIVTIADVRTVKIIAALAERYEKQVATGCEARIAVDTAPGKFFPAKVYSVYPVLDVRTRTLQVEIRADNSQSLLKPGMFATITLIPQKRDNVVVVPRDVVLGGRIEGTDYYVYTINGSVAHKRIVKIGITQGSDCEITDGLKPGEKLVINGMNYLADGLGVEVVRMEDIK